ncbi:hypothetical protein M011DRAFT_410270 [Sporormia fimetaria CBS 119925]|uniref:Na+/H+ antiporter-like protein Nha1 n=1 Tax=Sporormia fimetaria CBS 119925 TaxID=1340428 RepID=A0A6A6UZ92_9PLEO|nr:hypothetical protein M011DRAFT_410270 [Sporormia fimetaria CBS 119925]
MAWDHLSVTKPHLVYIILGGFTSLFMLCSSVIKERLYIGEATVATICGIIFGPHAADLIDPATWGNVDLITLEFSRIVLVVQCFAVGVELPRAYMEKHWRSVTLLLIPVMAWGWLITSLFIWWLFKSHLNWLDSLCIAACVTATDPVLASSVVGKGKFAKRIPKHLRDLLSAESGCNDGMAFPFVYLAVYAIRYRPDAGKVTFHWFCYTVLYECIFGAIFGVLIGYAARRAIRYAHEKDLIDRESFLVFYFVLALFCAGAGSMLGLDDLLVGFACGVGFSNDGWFLEKTEESHVSNVIDLLINLAFFVYFGTIIPWEQFNSPEILGITPWKLVVLGILVLFFRRIPIMLLLKPFLPDLKTWREALFAGHFGPIGVGGLFVAILARAELETESTTPLAVLPPEGFEHLNIIEMIWPITCFLVIVSILVHGSSIAVFTLGKHINTLTISLSYTTANEDGPKWMDRLPRIQSRSKSSMSLARNPSDPELGEKQDSSGGLLAAGVPGQFLRRQKEEEAAMRSSSLRPSVRRRKRESGIGAGGPVSQSAFGPIRSNREKAEPSMQDSDTLGGPSDESHEASLTKESSHAPGEDEENEEEIFQEGKDTVIEDEEGNVLGTRQSRPGETGQQRNEADAREAARLGVEKDVQHGVAQTEHGGKAERAPGEMVEAVKEGVHHPSRWNMRKRMQSFTAHHGHHGDSDELAEPSRAYKPAQKRGPALAYQFGNTIIVEDEDGEVIKKYEIPGRPKDRPGVERHGSVVDAGGRAMKSLYKMVSHNQHASQASSSAGAEGKKKATVDDDDDDFIRFTVTAGGRRMSKAEFIQQMSSMDPKSRAKFIEESDVPQKVKEEAKQDAKDAVRREKAAKEKVPTVVGDEGEAQIQKIESPSSARKEHTGPGGLALIDSNDEPVPFHSVRQDLANYKLEHSHEGETAAQRRRRLAEQAAGREDSEDSDTMDRPTISRSPSSPSRASVSSPSSLQHPKSRMDEGETAAERKRRLGALGIGDDNDDSPSSSDSDNEASDPLGQLGARKSPEERTTRPGIRFAEEPRILTKDERMAEKEVEEQGQGGSEHKKTVELGKLRLKFGKKK